MTSQFCLLLSRFFFVLDVQHFDPEMSAVEILLFILQKFISFLDAQDDVLIKFRKFNGSPLQYSCLENPMDRKAW